MYTIEHFDPQKHSLVCGLDVKLNLSVVEESYNKSKTNRFVPYRVCDYSAPQFFGEIGEFLIKDEWVVCEFGGPEWWEESNRLGCSQSNRKRHFEATRVFFDGSKWSKKTRAKMSESALKPGANPPHKKAAQSRAVTDTNNKKQPCPTCGKLMNIGNLTQHIRRAKCQSM
jgi:hypothetical protein